MSLRPARALRLGLPLLLALAAVGAFAFRVQRPSAPRRLLVAVTVPPQAWLVRSLGGDRVDVGILLPPGSSPHTYEPTPQQVTRLAQARLVVAVGHPSFLFERRLLDALLTRDPRPRVVDMSRHAPRLAVDGDGDPHLWLSPAVMRATASDLTAALSRLDPEGEALYRQRLAAVLAELDAVERDLQTKLADLPRRRFLVYHPEWGYFARDFGLEQVAIEAEGKEPSARALVALVDRLRRDGTRVVFVQRGTYDRPAHALAAEVGARVVVLDSLAEDWPTNLRSMGEQLREALGG